MKSRFEGACLRSIRSVAVLAVTAALLLPLAAGSAVTLTDPSPTPHTWDIDDAGTGAGPSYCGSGSIGNGSIDAYDTFGNICVIADGTAFTTACVIGDMFCGGSVAGAAELSGRQLVTGEAALLGLTIQRRAYVPSTGPADADAFVRYLDTFYNPTAAAITVQIRFGTGMTGSNNNDLGSDSSTTAEGSSSGDSVLEITDLWISTDDTVGSSDPSLAFVMQGLGASETVDFVGLNPYGAGDNSDLVWIFDSVTIGAGETIAFLTYMVQEQDQTLAQSEATYLVQIMLEAVEGLTGEQKTMVRNFAFCYDCDADGYAIEDGDCNDWDDTIHPGVTTDPCDGHDNDCDPSTPDGAVETWFGDPCDSDDHDLCADDSYACVDAIQGCLDTVNDLSDICDGLDNDCDGTTADGSQDVRVGVPCDGDDPDLCPEGDGLCVTGTFVCTDGPETAPDICDGVDNDCDPATEDGAVETWFGDPCDSTDADLCEDDSYACISAAMGCRDVLNDLSDVCDGVDNDCDATTADGSQDVRVGVACDGDDPDLCAEGDGLCVSGAFVCTDTPEAAPDVCDGIDNDCNPATEDGASEIWWDTACDSDDDDLCEDDAYRCLESAQACADNEEDLSDVCDGEDNDCNPGTDDGYGDERVGVACDGDDPDLCAEGIGECVGGEFNCTDTMDETPELCDNIDNDCDPSTADGLAEEWWDTACDGDDRDLCEEGTFTCIAGVKVCADSTGDARDVCDGVDNDCNPETADGTDESWYDEPCDGPDLDLCAEGTYQCNDGIQGCNDFSDDLHESCNGVDDDCDPSTLEAVDNDGDGYSACDGDCDDSNAAIFPGAEETICDGIDEDCDQFTDHDGDGDGYLDCDGDCAPMNPVIFPGAERNCHNGLDNNCNGVADIDEPYCGGSTDPDGGCACTVAGQGGANSPALLAVLAILSLLGLRLRTRRCH